jgi:hypothetical protein
MSESRRWRIALYLLGIALMSGLAGGLIGHAVARRQLEARDNPANWNEHVSREFDSIVQPTPDQAGKVQSHLDEAVRQLQQIRADAIQRSTSVIWRLVERVDSELTPEQRRAFEVMKPKSSDLTLDVLKVKP